MQGKPKVLSCMCRSAKDITNPTMSQTHRTASLLLRSIVFTLGLVLFLDGLILILNGKIHLGIILPILIGIGLCIYVLYDQKIQYKLKNYQSIARLYRYAKTGFMLWLCSVIIFFLYLAKNIEHVQPHKEIKAMLVLGSGIINNQPTPALAARLDQAAQLHQQYPQALIIVTGGVGYAKQYSEAEVMSDYLQHKHHIAAQHIALEAQSTSTELNLKNSQAILKQHQLSPSSSIAIVTSDFHTLRAAAIARKQGYQDIHVVSAPTPLSIRYNAWLREYFAYLSGWILNEY